MPRMGEGEVLTTIVGATVYANPPIYGIAVGGQVYEAADPNGVAPAVGNSVLADYLPSARQWVIVAILI